MSRPLVFEERDPIQAPLRVRQAGAGDRDRWNAMVAKARVPPLACFEWQAILEESYGVKCLFLLAEDETGRIRGMLPIFMSQRARVRRGYGLRFGLTTMDAAAATALLEEAERLSGAHRLSGLTVCSGYGTVELPARWRGDSRTTVILDLSPGEEKVWKNLRDKTRNAVRKGAKAGLRIDWDTAHLADFHAIYLDLMASRQRPAHSLAFFRCIFRHLPQYARLLTAHAAEGLVGGTIVLCTPSMHMSTFQAAAANANSRYNATTFMEWEMACSAIAAGAKRLDMGESTLDSGTYKFKTNFGGVAESVNYLSWAASSGPASRASQPASPGTSARQRVAGATLEHGPMWLRRLAALRRGRSGRII